MIQTSQSNIPTVVAQPVYVTRYNQNPAAPRSISGRHKVSGNPFSDKQFQNNVQQTPQQTNQAKKSCCDCLSLWFHRFLYAGAACSLLGFVAYTAFVYPGWLRDDANKLGDSTSEMPDPFSTEMCPAGVEYREKGGHIGVLFTSKVPCNVQAVVTNAANKWNSVLAAHNDLNPIPVGGINVKSTYCHHLQKGYTFEPTDVLDHLIIFAEISHIDGKGQILGGAAPCTTDGGGFPNIGTMQFDSIDAAHMMNEGTFDRVVLHEIGHVLGIGTIWDVLGNNLLKNPVYDLYGEVCKKLFFFESRLNLNAKPTSNGGVPEFTGYYARSAYQKLGGKGNVPVEDGRDANGKAFFNVGKKEGLGSIDSHWKQSVFQNELMTYSITSNANDAPLSEMSILSLKDLGYKVQESHAESYVLPRRFLRSSVRSEEEHKAIHVRNLAGDVPHWFNPHRMKTLVPLTPIENKGSEHVQNRTLFD